MDYLNQLLAQPATNTKSELELVLDLDETLAHSFTRGVKYRGEGLSVGEVTEYTPAYQDLRQRIYELNIDDCGNAAGTGNRYHMWGIKRPYVDQFIAWTFSYFKTVSVYSAGRKEYVPILVHKLFGHWEPHLQTVFNFDQVIRSSGISYKPLSRLEEYGVNPHRAIIIDDQPPAVEKNDNRGIIIPIYRPPITALAQRDAVLVAIMEWFMLHPNMSVNKLLLPTKGYLVNRNRELLKDPEAIEKILNGEVRI